MVVEFSRAGLAFLACLKFLKKCLAQGLEHLEITIIHHMKANKTLYQMVSKLNQSKIHQESYSNFVISIESDFFRICSFMVLIGCVMVLTLVPFDR